MARALQEGARIGEPIDVTVDPAHRRPLQRDPNRPQDVLKVDAAEEGVGGDDGADAVRYLVATKARVVEQRKLREL
jgi:hypothetical protein